MPKPRPGIEAGKRLSKCADIEVWNLVEAQTSDVIAKIDKLKSVEKEYRDLGEKIKSRTSISKEDLLLVVKWKFLVGKARMALMKHLESNSESSVQKHSKTAIELARAIPGNIFDVETAEKSKAALESLMSLKGVGPATASAILSLVRPDLFSYFYDEAIECFTKRCYNMKTYSIVNGHCIDIAGNLNNDWTPARVASALWVASKGNVFGLQDHTEQKQLKKESRAIDAGKGEAARPSKKSKR
jgi:hypothetical protein